MTEDTSSEKSRRVRPWIAPLLTFLGWGLGAYYSGKTNLAVRLCILQFTVGLFLGGIFLLLILNDAIPVSFLPAPNAITYFDAAIWLVSFLVAIFVFTQVSKTKSAPNRGLSGLLGYIGLWAFPVVVSVALMLTVRSYLIHPFHIPSGSMQPTIAVNDYVLIDKMRFRDKASTPERGEIIVFKNQKHGNRAYVSRVIGLPGEEIVIQDGEVFINGEKIPRQFQSTNLDGSASYLETLDNGTTYLTFDYGAGPLDNVGPYTVPPGHYFFMSDNRDRSQDSRVISRVGYISREHLVGPVMKIVHDKE